MLDNWTTNQIGTNLGESGNATRRLRQRCFCGVPEAGDFGNFYSSTDGNHWIFRTNNPNAWGLTLTCSGGLFVGISGFGWLASSADGTNWLFSSVNAYYPADDYNNHDITYANGTFVLAGDTDGVANIFTSPDGVNWTGRTLPNPGSSISSVMAYSAPPFAYFVAIGRNDGHLYYSSSSTGTTWLQRAIPGGASISHAGGLLIVPYGAGTNLVSTTGFYWTPYLTGLTSLMGTVTYAHGLFMAMAGGHLATSTNGINWVQYRQMIPGTSEVASDGNQLVTVGTTGTYLTSINGFAYSSGPLVGVRMTNGPPPQVALSGLAGLSYEVDYANSLSPTGANWQTLGNPATDQQSHLLDGWHRDQRGAFLSRGVAALTLALPKTKNPRFATPPLFCQRSVAGGGGGGGRQRPMDRAGGAGRDGVDGIDAAAGAGGECLVFQQPLQFVLRGHIIVALAVVEHPQLLRMFDGFNVHPADLFLGPIDGLVDPQRGHAQQQADDRHHHHDFNEGKTWLRECFYFFRGFHNVVSVHIRVKQGKSKKVAANSERGG